MIKFKTEFSSHHFNGVRMYPLQISKKKKKTNNVSVNMALLNNDNNWNDKKKKNAVEEAEVLSFNVRFFTFTFDCRCLFHFVLNVNWRQWKVLFCCKMCYSLLGTGYKHNSKCKIIMNESNVVYRNIKVKETCVSNCGISPHIFA